MKRLRHNITSPPLRERRLTILLTLAMLILALFGIMLIANIVLLLILPRGTVYPESLISYLNADYHAWDRESVPLLPPINPEVAAANARDRASETQTINESNTSGFGADPIAPLAILDENIPVVTQQPTITPTATLQRVALIVTQGLPNATATLTLLATTQTATTTPTSTATPVSVSDSAATPATIGVVRSTAIVVATLTSTRIAILPNATNTATRTNLPINTATRTAPATRTPLATSIPTATNVATSTSVATNTPTTTATATATATATSTPTATFLTGATNTNLPTNTPTTTATSTTTATASATRTITNTPTATSTRTLPPTNTATLVPCDVVVTNTNDAGSGSLRQALLNSNICPGTNTISFTIAGVAPYTIALLSALPAITEAVVIDGWSEPDFAGSPIIELNGSSAGTGADGLEFDYGSDGSSIRGLVINRFGGDGISVVANDVTIVGNYIGTNIAGNASDGNTGNGIRINGASGVFIGGTSTAVANTIAYNKVSGIYVGSGSNNAILGNAIYANGLGGYSGLGIDIGTPGVESNDGAKTPGQPNLLIDHPIITSASVVSSTLSVAGYVGVAPGDSDFADLRIEFFVSDNDPSGYGEGQAYLGTLQTNANGTFSGELVASGLSNFQITATATDSNGNTSEFGPNADVLTDTIWYLKDGGIPVASLSTIAPTAMILPNYDPGRDAFAGLLIAKGGVDFNEIDPTKHQMWLGPAGALQLDGTMSVTIWSAMKDFQVDKHGVVVAYLLDCASTGDGCVLIAQNQLDRVHWGTGMWVKDSISFGNIDYALGADRSLALTLIVSSVSDDDMWFAYDTTTYQSRLTYADAP